MSFFSKMIDKSISFCFIAYSKLACQQAIRWNDRASGFLKKNERACVWAASCERSFGGMHSSAGGVRRYNKVGTSIARSVPSKVQNCHSTLGHSPHIASKYPQNLHIPKKYSTFVPLNYSSLMKYRFADIVIDCSSHCVMRRAQRSNI